MTFERDQLQYTDDTERVRSSRLLPSDILSDAAANSGSPDELHQSIIDDLPNIDDILEDSFLEVTTTTTTTSPSTLNTVSDDSDDTDSSPEDLDDIDPTGEQEPVFTAEELLEIATQSLDIARNTGHIKRTSIGTKVYEYIQHPLTKDRKILGEDYEIGAYVCREIDDNAEPCARPRIHISTQRKIFDNDEIIPNNPKIVLRFVGDGENTHLTNTSDNTNQSDQDDASAKSYLTLGNKILTHVSKTVFAKEQDPYNPYLTESEKLKNELERKRQKRLRYLKNPLRIFSDYYTNDKYGEDRRNIAVISAFSLAYFLSPNVFGEVDAKVGPVPAGILFEVFVDWNNIPDHRATSFDTPEEALQLRLEDEATTELPVLDGYSVKNAPDGTFVSGWEDDDKLKDKYEEVKAGLWKHDFSLQDPALVDVIDESVELMESGAGGLLSIDSISYVPDSRTVRALACYTIHGDFVNYETFAFTKDEEVVGKISLDIVSDSEMEVCALDDDPITGTFYLYQGEPTETPDDTEEKD